MTDLGTIRGSGSWGVSTLRVNPVTNQPTITLFETESDAIEYARTRAMAAGSPWERPVYAGEREPTAEERATRRPVPSESGRVYFVLLMQDHEMHLRYRVLRGQRGARQQAGSSLTTGVRQEQVMVFENVGELPSGEIRWLMVKGLTIDVADLEKEREEARARRGTERLSREDAGELRRGHKGKTRQRVPVAFGPASEGREVAPHEIELANERRRRLFLQTEAQHAEEAARLAEKERRALELRTARLIEKRAELLLLKEHLESTYMKSRNENILPRIEVLAERIDAIERALSE